MRVPTPIAEIEAWAPWVAFAAAAKNDDPAAAAEPIFGVSITRAYQGSIHVPVAAATAALRTD